MSVNVVSPAPGSQLRLMAFDVDGVLTDGRLYFTESGSELKAFNTLDGHGLKLLREGGIELAIITGRRSGCVEHRARNLGIGLLYQGVEDKRAVMAQLLAERQIPFAQAGYMGDDVVDLPVMLACGFRAAPANAHPLVKTHAHYVAGARGGEGAAREVCEHLLATQGKLEGLLAHYLAPADFPIAP